MEKVSEFVEYYQVSMTAKEKDWPDSQEPWCEGARFYKVKLYSPVLGKFKTEWKCGPAVGGPDAESVLGCLQLDARIGVDTWEDYVSEFGMPETAKELIESQETWKTCNEHAIKLAEWCGPAFDRFMELEPV